MCWRSWQLTARAIDMTAMKLYLLWTQSLLRWVVRPCWAMQYHCTDLPAELVGCLLSWWASCLAYCWLDGIIDCLFFCLFDWLIGLLVGGYLIC